MELTSLCPTIYNTKSQVFFEIYMPQSEAQPTQNDEVDKTNEADIIDDDNQETQTIRKRR